MLGEDLAKVTNLQQEKERKLAETKREEIKKSLDQEKKRIFDPILELSSETQRKMWEAAQRGERCHLVAIGDSHSNLPQCSLIKTIIEDPFKQAAIRNKFGCWMEYEPESRSVILSYQACGIRICWKSSDHNVEFKNRKRMDSTSKEKYCGCF